MSVEAADPWSIDPSLTDHVDPPLLVAGAQTIAVEVPVPKRPFKLTNGEVKVGRHIPFAVLLLLLLLFVVEAVVSGGRWDGRIVG